MQASYFSFKNNNTPSIVYSQGINTGDLFFDFSVLSQPADQLQERYFLPGDDNVLREANLRLVRQEEDNEKISFFKKTWLFIKSIFAKPVNFVKNIFKKDTPIKFAAKDSLLKTKLKFNTYYLRVIPVKDGMVIGAASPEVKVKLTNPDNRDDIKIHKPAKLYEVKINEFKPIRAPEPEICNGAMILDTDWLEVKATGPVRHKAGDRICPAVYKGVGEQSWYESFWDFAKNGVNWVSEAYNDLKSAIVDGLAGLACGGNDECRMAISAGLDIGMVAMGVPPGLPNFDQLMDQGFDYLASEIAYQAGCPDAACKELIKQNLRKVLDEQKSVNPACLGEEEAHARGLEPLCLPNNVKAHVDPLGTYRGAEAILEVKRNYNDGSSLMGAPYKLYLNNWAYNAGPVGITIRNIEPYNKSVEITEPLEGPMFESKTIVVPPLKKGESIQIPIVLIPKEYWVPGHKEAMEGWSTVTYGDSWVNYQYDDWWKLYYGGTLSLGAAIDGCLENFGESDCIISSDQLTVTLPNSVNP